ncbi:MAG: PhnD/SsuA/transferrin family substrate-binding protein [Methylomonas sp.]
MLSAQPIKSLLSVMLLSATQFVCAQGNDYMPVIPHFIMGIYLPSVNDEINMTDIRVAMDYWLKELTADMNVVEGHAEFFMDMHEMAQSFNAKKLDMISAPALSIVKHFAMNDLSDGYAGVRTQGRLNSLVLLTKNDAAITGLANLRGKRLLMPNNDELSEIFIDGQTRQLFHTGYKQFFGSVDMNTKNSRMVLDLFFGKADAVLVYLSTYDVMVELNPQIKSNTKILLSYPLSSRSYGFFRREFLEEYQLRQPLKDFLAKIAEHPKLQEILVLFKTEAIVPVTIQELTPLRKMYEDYLKLNPVEK